MNAYEWDWGPYALDTEAEKRFVSLDRTDLLKICDVINVGREKPKTTGFVPVHYENGSLFVLKGENHVRVCGESGTKKSRTVCRGSIICSALCGHSIAVTDPKGKLYGDAKLQGILKERGYDIRCLNFRTMDQDGINLLGPAYDLFAQGKGQESDAYINRFLSMLTEDIGSPNQDPFWNNNSSLILAAAIRLLRNMLVQQNDRERFHLASVNTFLRQDKEELERLFTTMVQDVPVRDPLREYYNYLQSAADRTFSSLILTAQSLLSDMNSSDSLLRMLCADTFRMADLYTHKVAVFLIIPDETFCYNRMAGFVINLLYETLIQEFAAKYEGRRKGPPHRVNFICDEVASVKLQDINAKVSASRSRCISVLFIYQSEAQMRLVYSDYDTVVGNCRHYLFLGSSDFEQLRYVSQSLGQSGLSQEGSAPLVSVDDLRRMEKRKTCKDALVTVGNRYILCARLPDYDVYPFLKPIRIPEEKQNVLPQRIYLCTPEDIVSEYRQGKIKFPGGQSRQAVSAKPFEDLDALTEDFDSLFENEDDSWEE